jgi:hypothetical protein
MDGEHALTPADALILVHDLSHKLDAQQPAIVKADRYYTGTQPLAFVAPEVLAQTAGRLTSLVINWPRTIVDSVQRRCYVEGFRIGQGEIDEDLWRMWQASNLDRGHRLGQVDALVHARTFLSVGPPAREGRLPRIAVESAHQMVVEVDPASGEVVAALKRWADARTVFATLYLPDETHRFAATGVDGMGTAQSWKERAPVEGQPLGAVPVVPLLNRPRLLNPDGESELTDVMPLADAINKLASDMIVTSEFSAMPRRYATGIQIPSGPDRERLQAEAAQYWDQATKGKTWLAGEGVEFGQFPETSIASYTEGIRLLTTQIAAIAGLPPQYLGISTANPASADAIRSAEVTLVERAKDKQQEWGDAYEQAMRLALALRDGVSLEDLSGDLDSLETVWRETETPTVAQSMDAAVKGVQAGILDEVAAQERVGLSPMQRTAIAERREAAASSGATADVRARLDLARELQERDGLTQNAALAAAGLLQAASQNKPPSA